MSDARNARAHVRGARDGALATVSAEPDLAGYPFGSVVPYALDATGAPLILISRIAQHTKNLAADPRASLLVRSSDHDGDPQAAWRVTLVGEFVRLASVVDDPDDGPGAATVLSEDALLEAQARYLERAPQAVQYYAVHDFDLWRLSVRKVRLIEGFGRIRWVDAAAYSERPDDAGWAGAAAGVLEHMNADHAEALRDYCEGFRGFRPEAAELVAVDPGGFLVRCRGNERLEYFSFPVEVEAAQARVAFVELLKAARAKIGAGE